MYQKAFLKDEIIFLACMKKHFLRDKTFNLVCKWPIYDAITI